MQRESQASASTPGTAILAAVLVLVAALAVYVPALDGPLIFDDAPNLLNNGFLQLDGRDFDDWRIAAGSGLGMWPGRPLAMLTFAANQVAGDGLTASGLKAVNLAIHLGIGGLLFLLFGALLQAPALSGRYSLSQGRWLALAAAAIWLLHPLQVSTVLYAVQRMAQLSALFMVAGMLVFTRYRLAWARRGVAPGEPLAAFLWLLLLGVLGFLSKENAALLPALLLVMEVCLFRGVIDGRERHGLARLAWVALLLPLVILALVWIFDSQVLTSRYANREFSLEERVLTQGRVLWRYIGWLVFPNILDMGFHHDDIQVSKSLLAPMTGLLALVAWVAVLAVALRERRRYPLLLFVLLFYLAGHAMESTGLPLEMVYEHRNYLPGTAVCLALAAGLFGLSRRYGRLKAGPLCGAVLVGLAVLLAIRGNAWSSEMTLARYNVINHPLSPRAHFFYGDTLYKHSTRADELGLSEEEKRDLIVAARQHFERMQQLSPRELAAPVMLLQLDMVYFPGMPDAPDWLGTIRDTIGSRPLQSSDRTALGGLVRFALSPAGEPVRGRVMELIEDLARRYPHSRDVFPLRYKLSRAAGEASPLVLPEALEQQIASYPERTELYAHLVQYHRLDNPAATYEAIRAWMAQDPGRRELAVIRQLFTPVNRHE